MAELKRRAVARDREGRVLDDEVLESTQQALSRFSTFMRATIPASHDGYLSSLKPFFEHMGAKPMARWTPDDTAAFIVSKREREVRPWSRRSA